MNHPTETADFSLKPSEGWHCSHLYYRFNRPALKRLSAAELAEGQRQFIARTRSDHRRGAPRACKRRSSAGTRPTSG